MKVALHYPSATLPRSWSIWENNIYIYTDSYINIYTYAMLSCAMLCCAALRCAMLCYAMLCCAVLC
eukprot:941219-Pyramimonas_sp.AAC.1